MKKKTVPCYLLLPLLTPEQLSAVTPFLRATFTETWAATYEATPFGCAGPGQIARYQIRESLRETANGMMVFDENIEQLLYRKAKLLGHAAVPGPARNR